MKIMIESTDQVTSVDGVKARVWNGVTEGGSKCILFIHRIAVRNSEDQSQFDRELQEQLPPGRAIPLSAVL